MQNQVRSKARNLQRPCSSLSVGTKSLGIEIPIPTPLHPATKGMEDGLNGEERACEVVERIYAYLHNLL